jgi:hypothetical protein
MARGGEICETCGHSHAPDPSTLSGDRFDWRTAWSAMAAVGIRHRCRTCSPSRFSSSWRAESRAGDGASTGVTVAILATLEPPRSGS